MTATIDAVILTTPTVTRTSARVGVVADRWTSQHPTGSLPYKSNTAYPEHDNLGRAVATNPDDDEEFLRRCRERAEEQRRKAAEQQRRRAEQDRGESGDKAEESDG